MLLGGQNINCMKLLIFIMKKKENMRWLVKIKIKIKIKIFYFLCRKLVFLSILVYIMQLVSEPRDCHVIVM